MSDKYKSKVERRYNDFLHLHSQLLTKYSNRMIPKLPPKQLMLDSFLEERRSGLERWLRLMSHHPLFSLDEVLKCFLTETSVDYLCLMDEELAKNSDEFLQIPITTQLPVYDFENLINNRDNMRVMLNLVVKIKRLIKQQASRELCQSKDFSEIANALDAISGSLRDKSFDDFSTNFTEIAKESEKASRNQERAVGERLEMVIDVLVAHSDMCERVEKSINSDHQALTKTLNINKEKIRNVIRGTTAAVEVSSHHQSEADALDRRNAFATFCVNQETKFVKKYLKLLPSILLQFSHEEARGFTSISEILNKIVQIESDKLN